MSPRGRVRFTTAIALVLATSSAASAQSIGRSQSQRVHDAIRGGAILFASGLATGLVAGVSLAMVPASNGCALHSPTARIDPQNGECFEFDFNGDRIHYGPPHWTFESAFGLSFIPIAGPAVAAFYLPPERRPAALGIGISVAVLQLCGLGLLAAGLAARPSPAHAPSAWAIVPVAHGDAFGLVVTGAID